MPSSVLKVIPTGEYFWTNTLFESSFNKNPSENFKKFVIFTELFFFLQVSLAILIGLLLVSGVGVFLWMAALKWKDMIGLSVGVIFLLLAATQVWENNSIFRIKERFK